MERRSFVLSLGASVYTVKSCFGGFASAQEIAELTGVPQEVMDLLDPELKGSLLDLTDLGTDSYYTIAQYDELGTGEPVFIRKPGDGEAVIISDANALPMELRFGTSFANAAAGINTADVDISGYSLDDRDLEAYVSSGNRAPAANIDSRVSTAATSNLGMISRNATGTNRGRLACAWAVNTIVSMTLGRPIGGGLATANMVQVLRARHAAVLEASAPAGSIVISPTEYRGNRANVGHVGILGKDGKIFSNSSTRAKWEQNFTVSSWNSYYKGKGLSVSFFRLDGDYF